jgi:hypothetical protein
MLMLMLVVMLVLVLLLTLALLMLLLVLRAQKDRRILSKGFCQRPRQQTSRWKYWAMNQRVWQ